MLPKVKLLEFKLAKVELVAEQLKVLDNAGERGHGLFLVELRQGAGLLLIGQFEKAVEVLHNITAEAWCGEEAAVRDRQTPL